MKYLLVRRVVSIRAFSPRKAQSEPAVEPRVLAWLSHRQFEGGTMRAPFSLFLGLVLSGCVFQPKTPEQIAAEPFRPVEEPQVVCRKEKPTGSNRPVTVCREVPTAIDREDTKRDMNVLQRQSEQINQQLN